MSEQQPPEHISDDEWLARFVVFGRWVRENGTVRPDAFVPPPDLNLSVTRHLALSDEQLWARGADVASARNANLTGRADLRAAAVRSLSPLNVLEATIAGNPEHAHIVGWPADKPSQKMLAQQLAASAKFIPAPSR